MHDIIEDCQKKGSHNLTCVYRFFENDQYGEEVRWCRTCGAIVGDFNVDGRVMAGQVFAMCFPEAIQQGVPNNLGLRTDNQWCAEIEKFFPSLKLMSFHSAESVIPWLMEQVKEGQDWREKKIEEGQ